VFEKSERVLRYTRQQSYCGSKPTSFTVS